MDTIKPIVLPVLMVLLGFTEDNAVNEDFDVEEECL